MKPIVALRRYFGSFSPRAARLLLLGLLPVLAVLFYLSYLFFLSPGLLPVGAARYRFFSLAVDSVGISLLLLLCGGAIFDYAEKHDPKP